VFEGKYQKGEKINGRYAFKNNNLEYVYEGNFLNNLFHGSGTLKNAKGTY
jgi:hypothetical protein